MLFIEYKGSRSNPSLSASASSVIHLDVLAQETTSGTRCRRPEHAYVKNDKSTSFLRLNGKNAALHRNPEQPSPTGSADIAAEPSSTRHSTVSVRGECYRTAVITKVLPVLLYSYYIPEVFSIGVDSVHPLTEASLLPETFLEAF